MSCSKYAIDSVNKNILSLNRNKLFKKKEENYFSNLFYTLPDQAGTNN